MRVHTNVLSTIDVYKATEGLPGVHATAKWHGSRTHDGAIEISLEGNGYRKNSGNYGASDEYGATWDEWGVVIARLLDVDPKAVFGTVKRPVYDGSHDFHEQTRWRFEGLELPEDTHKRHNWQYAGPRAQSCKKCTAEFERP